MGSCFSWPEALDLSVGWKEMSSLCCLFLSKGNVVLGAALLGNALDPEPRDGMEEAPLFLSQEFGVNNSLPAVPQLTWTQVGFALPSEPLQV